MKTSLIITGTLLLMLLNLRVFSQGLEYGLRGGFNAGTPYGKAEDGSTGKPGVGPAFGLYFNAQLNFKWQVQAEFLYSKKGSSFRTPVSGDTIYKDTETNPGHTYYWHTVYNGWVEGEYDNTYLDIPVLFIYRFNPKWNIMFGPQFSYLLEGDNSGTADIEVGNPENPFTTVEDEPFDQSEHLKTWDYGVIVGGKYHITHKMDISLTLSSGLVSIYEKNYKYLDKTIRNIYLRATLGFRISRDREE
ncbi:MAG: PorT family protein [Bacteroidales bacterium]|nr:PorT family protein [Bacteroidales bacterium]MCF8349812.1 PorT family protein [Bacteroidales bacterium]MCF8375932.1 PorT family protein [Bacteroidales bacterium]